MRFRLAKDSDLAALRTGDAGRIQVTCEPTQPAADASTRPPGLPKVALILGANGFVGVHLIEQLARHPAYGMIFCLARAKDAHGSKARVRSCMDEYRIELTEQQADKLVYITGSLAEPEFGLKSDLYDILVNEVDAVFHLAGNTDYTLPYEQHRALSVTSMIDLANFCARGRPKQLHYLSSCITSLYREPEDFQKSTWWYSGYAKMKWVNNEVLRQLRRHGLKTAVYKAPYILGHSDRHLDPGMHYTYWRAILGILRVGVVWRGSMCQAVPVDVVCELMAGNASREDPTFQITPVAPDISAEDFAALFGLSVVDDLEECRALIFKAAGHLPEASRFLEGVDEQTQGKSVVEPEIPAWYRRRIPAHIELIQWGLAQERLRHILEWVAPRKAAT